MHKETYENGDVIMKNYMFANLMIYFDFSANRFELRKNYNSYDSTNFCCDSTDFSRFKNYPNFMFIVKKNRHFNLNK